MFVVGLSFEIRKMYFEFFEENEVLFFFLEMIFLDCLLKKKKEKVKICLDVLKKKCSKVECLCYKLELEYIIDGKKFGLYFIINLVSLDYFLVIVLIDESKILFDYMIE